MMATLSSASNDGGGSLDLQDSVAPVGADAVQTLDSGESDRKEELSNPPDSEPEEPASRPGATAVDAAEAPFQTGIREPSNDTDLASNQRHYWFEREIDQNIDRYKQKGKDPHDLFDPSKPDYLGTPEALLPHFGPGVAAAAARYRAAQAVELNGSSDASERQTGERPTAIPVHADDSAFAGRPRYPAFPSSPEWENMFVRGMQGLIHTLRGRFGGSRSDDDDDFCYKRFDDEVARCRERQWQVAHPDYTSGCIKRAEARRNMCVQNGGRPHPNEPREWDPDRDEESWINPDR